MQEAYERELFRVTAAVAVVWLLAALVPALLARHGYRHPAVPILVWLAMLAAAAWLLPQARSGGLATPQAAVAVTVALAVVALLGWQRGAHSAASTTDWSVFGTGWLLILIVLSRPAWIWAPAGLLVFATDAFFAIRLLGTSQANLARLETTGYVLAAILIVFASVRPGFRTHARLAAHRAALVNRSAAEQAALAALAGDRRERLAVLETAALPLLRGIADGSLDPADGEVRRRCAEHAAALRRALSGGGQQASGLLAELAPALAAAAGRGLPVDVQVVGDPGRPVPRVAAAALAALDRVLRALPPRPVTVTVLASGGEVEVFLPFAAPYVTVDVTGLGRDVPAAACWYAAVAADDAGGGCFEARWREVTA